MFKRIKEWWNGSSNKKVSYDENVIALYEEYRKNQKLLKETTLVLDEAIEKLQRLEAEAERLAGSNRKLRETNKILIEEKEGLVKENKTLTLLLKDVYQELKEMTSKKDKSNISQATGINFLDDTNGIIEKYTSKEKEVQKEEELQELKEEFEEMKKPRTLKEVRELLNKIDLRA